MSGRDAQVAQVRERVRLLVQLDAWLETPLLVLAFVWLALFVYEVLYGLSPTLTYVGYVIWAVFALEFCVELLLAPRKRRYLARNWLKLLALIAPALRVLRLARVMRLAAAGRGMRLIRILSSLNRGLRAVRATMRRHGFGYLVMSTLLVTVAGAAGMFAFESDTHPEGFGSFTHALWWTAMLMTSLGSEFWPRSPEGRLLALLLSLYAVAVFGYITATLAAFFIGRDAASARGEVASDRSLRELREEVASLRGQLAAAGVVDGAGTASRPARD